jgi:hypothetical protein
MTGILNILAGSIAAAIKDGYFNLVTLLLPGNGTNGAQNNTFLDSSSNNFTITRNGNTTQGAFSPFSQTGWGNYFGGDGNYLSTAYSADFDFGTGDFSIEAWVYPIDAGRGADSSKFGAIISQGASGVTTNFWGFYLLISGSNVTQVLFDVGASTALSATSLTYPINTWHHFVVCRSGTTLSLFVDGTRVATATYSSAINANSSGTVQVARYAYGSPYQNWLQGNISNVRVLKGSSAYSASSSTLTVPTASLTDVTNTKLLTCLSNRFVDANTQVTAKTITVTGTPSVQAFSPFAPTAAYSASTNGGSGYFDGTGDYLSAASNAAFAFGTGDFSVEFWFYPTVSSQDNYDKYFSTGNAVGNFYIDQQTIANQITINDGSTVFVSSSSNLTPFAWNHVVVSRVSTTLRIFLNGAQVGSVTNSTNFTQTGAFVAANGAGASNVTGYFSGFRVVKGSGVSSVTVPTTPPTAITNTQLLLNYTNAGIVDSTGKNVLETVGNAQISTTQSKFGGSSMAFDGTGDYLRPNNGQIFNFGTGDFTIEFWLYLTSVASQSTFVDCRPGSAGDYILFDYDPTSKLRLYVNTTTVLSGTTLSTGQWYHIALARSGTSVAYYVNGTQSATGTMSTNLLSAANPYIGANYVPGSYLNGYIDDFRVTKGYARYTANFTPPAAAFPVQ